MNRPDLYKKTVDILFDAYFNDTLKHCDSCGCAVGNIVAANMEYKIYRDEKGDLAWGKGDGRLFLSHWDNALLLGKIYESDLFGETEREVRSTGYSIYELAEIEIAFEKCPYSRSKEDWMFNGLVAVLDVLKKIHEVEDNETDVQRFRNHYQTLTV